MEFCSIVIENPKADWDVQTIPEEEAVEVVT
jgi:hypothetical protein